MRSKTNQRVRVESIKPGDSILTTTGMRTVTKVNIAESFVTVYVDDPANAPTLVTALDYFRGSLITVVRAK